MYEIFFVNFWVIILCRILKLKNLKLFLTRNSLGDEIANVNFLCDDILHTQYKIQ